jgi:hypothetical protein
MEGHAWERLAIIGKGGEVAPTCISLEKGADYNTESTNYMTGIITKC